MSYVHYVDLVHELDTETEQHRATIYVRVENVSRPDAAAIADAVEQCARRVTEQMVDEHAN